MMSYAVGASIPFAVTLPPGATLDPAGEFAVLITLPDGATAPQVFDAGSGQTGTSAVPVIAQQPVTEPGGTANPLVTAAGSPVVVTGTLIPPGGIVPGQSLLGTPSVGYLDSSGNPQTATGTPVAFTLASGSTTVIGRTRRPL